MSTLKSCCTRTPKHETSHETSHMNSVLILAFSSFTPRKVFSQKRHMTQLTIIFLQFPGLFLTLPSPPSKRPAMFQALLWRSQRRFESKKAKAVGENCKWQGLPQVKIVGLQILKWCWLFWLLLRGCGFGDTNETEKGIHGWPLDPVCHRDVTIRNMNPCASHTKLDVAHWVHKCWTNPSVEQGHRFSSWRHGFFPLWISMYEVYFGCTYEGVLFKVDMRWIWLYDMNSIVSHDLSRVLSTYHILWTDGIGTLRIVFIRLGVNRILRFLRLRA